VPVHALFSHFGKKRLSKLASKPLVIYSYATASVLVPRCCHVGPIGHELAIKHRALWTLDLQIEHSSHVDYTAIKHLLMLMLCKWGTEACYACNIRHSSIDPIHLLEVLSFSSSISHSQPHQSSKALCTSLQALFMTCIVYVASNTSYTFLSLFHASPFLPTDLNM
jgi:hypothetical protein